MDVSTNLVEKSVKINTNNTVNTHFFLLDPLSVIIKLAILGNKPVGTKILIQNNVIYFQEPGIFQPIARMFYKTNKEDLQYLYNPIHIACAVFLKKEYTQKYPRIKQLFHFAQNGLKKLMETYENFSIIKLCFNYYYIIITNNIEDKFNDTFFNKDEITVYYTKERIDKLNEQWTHEKIKIVLDIIHFLTNNPTPSNNIKTLETIMVNNDLYTQQIVEEMFLQ
jgi:hypothetical protein